MVIGYGSIGKRHIQNLLKLSNVDIIVYTKQKPKKIQNCQFYSDIKKCLQQNPDAAIISNITSEHTKTIQLLIKNNIDLLIEKPLSNSFYGINKLLLDVKKKKIITLMGCQFRFHQCIKKIKELIDKEKVGRVLSVQVECGSYLPDWHENEDYRKGYAGRKELGGGVVLTCIHELDYLYWLFGDVNEVFSVTQKISDLEINVDDLSAIIMKFKNNVIGEIHLDFFQKPNTRSCKIVGTKGTIHWNSDENSVNYFNNKKNNWTKILKIKNYSRNQMFVEEISHFIDCVKLKKDTINPIQEGAKTLKIALGIMKSSKSRKMVKI